MNRAHSQSTINVWAMSSIVMIAIGVLLWCVQLMITTKAHIWVFIFIIHPIGVALGIISDKTNSKCSYFAIFGNLFLTFSFIPVIFILYLLENEMIHVGFSNLAIF